MTRSNAKASVQRIPRIKGQGGRMVPLLRRSWIENFLTCPAYASDNSERAQFGTMMHEGIHVYLRECVARKQDSLLSEVDRIAREVFHRVPRGIPPGRLFEFRELLDHFARALPVDRQNLLRTEFPLFVDVGWAVLTCHPDGEWRTDSGDVDDPVESLVMRDWKTSWNYGENLFQTRFYVMSRALQPDAEGLEEITFETWPLRGFADPIEYTFTRYDWEQGELRDWWENDVLKPLRDRFPQRAKLGPRGGAACEYCAKRLYCGESVPPASIAPETQEDLVEFFTETRRVEELYKTRRDAIRMFMKNRKPVVIEGYEVGNNMPREAQEEPRVIQGRDEEVIEYMNSIMPGAGDMVRRQGVWPKLINPEWWRPMKEKGLIEIIPKKTEFGWRKYRPPKNESVEETG